MGHGKLLSDYEKGQIDALITLGGKGNSINAIAKDLNRSRQAIQLKLFSPCIIVTFHNSYFSITSFLNRTPFIIYYVLNVLQFTKKCK